MKRFSSILIVATLSLAAACTAESDPTATPEPSEEAAESTAALPSEGGGPSFQPGAGDLAGILPETVGELTISYEYAEGEEVFGDEGLSPEALDFLTNVGADAEDISTAFGFAFDAESEAAISVLVLRVAGANEDTLRQAFIDTIESDGDTIGTETTLGGKTVQAYSGEEVSDEGYLYVNGDLVFAIGGSPVELVEEFLAALP